MDAVLLAVGEEAGGAVLAASFMDDQFPGLEGGLGAALEAKRPKVRGADPDGIRWNCVRAWAKSTGLLEEAAVCGKVMQASSISSRNRLGSPCNTWPHLNLVRA